MGATELESNPVVLMSGGADWDEFKLRLDKARPKFGNTLEMDV